MSFIKYLFFWIFVLPSKLLASPQCREWIAVLESRPKRESIHIFNDAIVIGQLQERNGVYYMAKSYEIKFGSLYSRNEIIKIITNKNFIYNGDEVEKVTWSGYFFFTALKVDLI